jgi:hypothetical protein
MKKRVFTEVKKSLRSLCALPVKGHAESRINTLCGLIVGQINSKSSTIPGLSKGIAKNNKGRSQEAHAQRFLENKSTDFDVHFLPFLDAIISENLKKQGKKGDKIEITLAVDGSVVNSEHIALMLSMVLGKRSIPICWVVKRGKKGHFSTDMHLEVVTKAAAIFQNIFDKLALSNPFFCQRIPITLLGDGEFDSVELQELCQTTLRWKYVVRTAKDSKLYEGEDCFEPQDICFDDAAYGNEPFVFIENIEYSNAKLKNVAFLYWHDKKMYDDPIYLLSNLDDPFLIVAAYRKRFSIETLFKDLKTRGFNLHKNRQTRINAVFNLIMITALSFCIIMNFGEKNNDNKLKDRIKRIEKKNYSIFYYGYEFFYYCLFNDIEFSFSFDKTDFSFDKNSYNSA